MNIIKTYLLPIASSILAIMGTLHLLSEASEKSQEGHIGCYLYKIFTFPFGDIIMPSVVIGIGVFLFNGYFISGSLKKRVEITSNALNIKVTIMFGDLFKQTGWKTIGVNDFFDSEVDDDLVASKSLHGQVINDHWPEGRQGWQSAINSSLENDFFQEEGRREGSKGNTKRYAIGTTASALAGSQKFLFVAIGNTDTNTNVTTADAEDLMRAIKGLLQKARQVCAGETLYIPLIGSGLSRVGMKDSVLVDLIMTAIFEEAKKLLVTKNITILLPVDQKYEINVHDFTRRWN